MIEELMVEYNHILVYPFHSIHIREKPVKDGLSLYVQQDVGKFSVNG